MKARFREAALGVQHDLIVRERLLALIVTQSSESNMRLLEIHPTLYMNVELPGFEWHYCTGAL